MEKPSASSSGTMRNVITFSLGYMLLIGAWLTICAIQQAILFSVQKEDPTFTGNGFISMSIVNGVFAFANFLMPMVISCAGLRTTMTLGTAVYVIYIGSFFFQNVVLLYGTSVLVGFASACIWVTNGIYITKCSTKDTINKNMGLYWVIMSFGQLFGNGFVFWKLQGVTHIDKDTRIFMISMLAGMAALATIILGSLRPPRVKSKDAESGEGFIAKADNRKRNKNWCKSLTEPFREFKNVHMLLLVPSCIYNGLEIAFFIIYPTSVGFSEALGEDSRKYTGFAGIAVGVGSLLAGLAFGVFGRIVVKGKRQLVIIIAFIAHCAALTLIYLNLPDAAALGPTLETSTINPPSAEVAILCAFLLGTGDGCISPTLGAAIGAIWPENPSAPLSNYRFLQGGTCAVAFVVSTMTGLHNQMLILLIVGFVATTTFFINEILFEKKFKNVAKPVVQLSQTN